MKTRAVRFLLLCIVTLGCLGAAWPWPIPCLDPTPDYPLQVCASVVEWSPDTGDAVLGIDFWNSGNDIREVSGVRIYVQLKDGTEWQRDWERGDIPLLRPGDKYALRETVWIGKPSNVLRVLFQTQSNEWIIPANGPKIEPLAKRSLRR